MSNGGDSFFPEGDNQFRTWLLNFVANEGVVAPLVAGQPEVREYRAQGRVNNVRVGPMSAIVSGVTVP